VRLVQEIPSAAAWDTTFTQIREVRITAIALVRK
jgi:hypothetical protein